MLGHGHWLRKAALLLALCASVAGGTVPQIGPGSGWKPDPDDQFLLDVRIRQLRLGDGVRAYNAPEGTCVVLGDFLTTLDVPMRIDLIGKKATGWALKESNRISIDYGTSRASYGGGKSETFQPGTIRETPEGWCVQTKALARWFGIGVTPVTNGSVLLLQSEAKLPIELAMERQARAAHLRPANFDLSGLPQVRVPYRMWRAPALDVVVSAGVTYSASKTLRFDRQSSLYAAGEIAHLSYDAQVTTTEHGKPSLMRLRAFRSDPDGNLMGPLQATHFGFGDVEGFDSGLTGSLAAGRGAVVTNRPLAARAAFDRTRFEGDLPSGWEAELYRNGELLGFAKSEPTQRYVFDNIQLLYGENRIEIRLYGPQGQVRTRQEIINVGQDNVPAGKTWYWVGINQPGHDLVELEKPPDAGQPQAQATLSFEHGVNSKMSVGVLASAMLINDQRVSFIEGDIRRSIGPALVQLGAARESNGGMAAHAQLLGKFGAVNVSAETLVATNYHLQGGPRQSVRDMRVGLDAPLRLGRTVLPAHLDARLIESAGGAKELEAAARLAANIGRFNLSTNLRYQKQYVPSGPPPSGALDVGFIGTGHIGGVRIRGEADFDVSPRARVSLVDLSAYWSVSQNADWEGELAYDATTQRARARISHIRRLNTLALALTGEAASDGSLAFGVNLAFSLDPNHGFNLSRRPIAQAGSVHALVYRDLNGNGVHDPGEPYEKGAIVTTGTVQSERPTDANGSTTVGGLTAYLPITVGLDASSISDPMLVPSKALQVVVPRPGVPAEVEIGLVGGGDIEGALIKNGGMGFEGLDLELVDRGGKVITTTRTDFDGFFLFERVAYGRYTIRIAKASAKAAGLQPDIAVWVEVTAGRAVVRLGGIQVRPVPVLAAAGS